MPSLQEIIEGDLGLGSEETQKTASQNTPESSGNDEIEKLAMELGLADDSSDSGSVKTNQNGSGHSKEASMSLDSIYADMFPGDADVIGGLNEKTASENEGIDKEAAAREERIGRAAFDSFVTVVDRHLDKIAEELSGSATVDVDKDPDEEPSQTMTSNKPADSDQAIDTKPKVTDEVSKGDDNRVSGHFEQRGNQAPKGSVQYETKQAAVRKHLLLLAMDK